jgi:hypothetical protein
MQHNDPTAGVIALPAALRAFKGFTQIPNAILRSRKLTMRAKLAYAALLSYAWQDDQCFPGQARLAADLGDVSLDTVQRALRELRAANLLRWSRRGMPARNVYTLLELPDDLDAGVQAQPDPEREAPDAANLRHQDAAPERHQDAAPVRHEEYTREEDPVSRSSVPSEPQNGPPRARRRARKPAPEPTGVRTLIDAFAAEHERVLNERYLVAGPRDGKWAKKAIKTYGLERALSAVAVYFTDKRSIMALGADIPKFVARIATLGVQAAPVNPKTAGNAAAVQAFLSKGRKP